MKDATFGRGKDKEEVEIITHDLRALLFWATKGVGSAAGGSYETDIVDIIESYANYLGLNSGQFPHWPPRFMEQKKFAAKLLRSIPSKKRIETSRKNGKKGGRPKSNFVVKG